MEISMLQGCLRGVAKYMSRLELLPLEDVATPPSAPAAPCAPLRSAGKYGASRSEAAASTASLPELCLGNFSEDEASQSGESDSSLLQSEALTLEQDIGQRLRHASDVQAWNQSHFVMVRNLQMAPRNQGSVELMQSLAHGGEFVAVKKMPNSWVMSGHEEFRRTHLRSSERPWFDVAVVRYLHDQGCQYICEPHGVFRDHCSTYVVTSWATQGDLFSWMDRDPGPGPDREEMLRPIARQIFGAVQHLHNLGIAHRDLSLENLVLTDGDQGPIVKLIDFGMAGLSRHCQGANAKRSYVAPELHKSGDHDAFLSDAFAVGVILFAAASCAYPWESTKPGLCRRFDYVETHGLQAYLERRRLTRIGGLRLAEVLSRPFVSVLAGLLAPSPAERWGLGERCWQLEAGPRPRTSVWSAPWVAQRA